jgi:type IV pilus assembly protein PilP
MTRACPRSAASWATLALFAVLFLTGCEDEVVQGVALPAPPADAGASVSVSSDAAPPKIDFQETEFAESDRSRDPFRANAALFVEEVRGRVRSQREVVLDDYSLDELKLVGIVTRIEPAKAMLVDPSGKGHVVQRGQFIGRPEVVQSTGSRSATYEINWRVDRIREGDIVLVREDPANPDVPSATKVIPLRPEALGADNGVARTLQ